MKYLALGLSLALLLSAPVQATEPAITEISDEAIVIQHTNRVFRPVSRNIVVPDNLAGEYVVAVAVVTGVALTDAQETALENAIENIAGVTLAKVLVGSSRLSHDRLPADIAPPDGIDYQLGVRLEMGFTADGVPVPQ